VNLAAVAARGAELYGDRRLRLAVAVLGFAAVTYVTVLIAHPTMFAAFHNYDDEGYMLTALKSFVNHGHLYDRVFTQYGPFFYEFWGGVFSLFGIDVTHDSGRTMTMIVWVLASLVFGLGAWRITRSLFLALGTQVLTFTALGVLNNEPMHPIGLIGLLLAVIVVVSTFVGEADLPSPYPLALIGAAVAALVLTKINVGVFAVVSIALVCAVSYRELWGRRWPRLLIEVVFVATPILLMLSKFDEGWVRHYAIHVAVTALAVVIALRANQPARRKAFELRWLIGGFVVLAIVCCVTIVASGTSPGALIEGVISQPLHQSDAFTIPMLMARRVYAFDLVALGAACAYWYGARRGGEPSQAWLAAWSLFAIVVGVTMALSIGGGVLPFDDISMTGYAISMLPFAWVALATTTTARAATPGAPSPRSFARLLLPVLATLQALHGYPVSGSQTYLAIVLLVPTGALCVANGVTGLSRLTPIGPDRIALAGFGALVAVVLAWFTVNTYLRESLNLRRGIYDTAYSMGLPGSDDIRLGIPAEIKMYQDVSHAIKRDCAATLMEPGMDSFYLWAEQEPPSFTATAWPTLFNEAHQRAVVEATDETEDLCLLRNRAIGWEVKNGVLEQYLEKGFRPIGKWGDYELLRRDGPAAAGA
jgi:hypothetical protein